MKGNAVFRRRSIRKFLDKKIECSHLENILRAGMQAPSAHNFKPWEFVVTEDREKLKKIATYSPYSMWAEKAPAAIVVCGNLKDVERDDQWWEQDLSAAIQNILIQTVEEGLGAVWLGFYPVEERVEKLRKLFELPEEIVPFAVIALGYSEDENTFIDRYDGSKVHFEKFVK